MSHFVSFFLIGAILPLPFYFLAKAYPRGWFKYVNIPVAFTGIGNLPPATGIKCVVSFRFTRPFVR